MEHRRENHQRISGKLVVQLLQTPAQVALVATEIGPATMDRVAGGGIRQRRPALTDADPEPPALARDDVV
jgi:hypothetical protein